MAPDPQQQDQQPAEPETPTERQQRVSRVQQAAELRRRTARATSRAFDTRTELWQEAGLAGEVDQQKSRHALRRAFLFLILIVGVLLVFAYRKDLFPSAGKEIRYVTAGLLVILGWGFASAAGKGMAPVMMRRLDPASAGTAGFLVRLVTIVIVVLGSLAIAGVDPQVLLAGGAFTAVVVGLAAQQTLGNVIAGATLLTARPFRVGDRVGVMGGGIVTEGTVAAFGLFYTTLLDGQDRILIPNSVLMGVAVIPQGEPNAVALLARFESRAITPKVLQERLDEQIDVELVRAPTIELEEMDSDEIITLRIKATPIDPADGPLLASEVLEAIRIGGGQGEATDPHGEKAVDRLSNTHIDS